MKVTFYYAMCKVYNKELDRLEDILLYYTRERILKKELAEQGLKLIQFKKIPVRYELSHEYSKALSNALDEAFKEEQDIEHKDVTRIYDEEENETC